MQVIAIMVLAIIIYAHIYIWPNACTEYATPIVFNNILHMHVYIIDVCIVVYNCVCKTEIINDHPQSKCSASHAAMFEIHYYTAMSAQ